MFQHQPIYRKLRRGFLLATAISVLIAVLGGIGLITLAVSSRAMYEKQTKPLTDISFILEHIHRMQVEVRQGIISYRYTAGVLKSKDEVAELHKSYQEALMRYLETITDETILLHAQNADRLEQEVFLTAVNKALDQAAKINFGTATEIMSDVSDDIEDMLEDFNTCFTLTVQQAENGAASSQSLAALLIALLITIGTLGVVASLLLSKRLSAMISEPIEEMVTAAGELAEGNASIDVAVRSKDEIGKLAQSFNSIVAGFQQQAATIVAFEQGHLNVEHAPRSEKDNVGRALAGLLDQYNEIFTTIHQVTDQVNAGAEQLASGASALSAGATEQAASVQELSSVIEEIAGKVDENVAHVREVVVDIGTARTSVTESNEQMMNLVGAMQEIQGASSQISTIMKVIDDIAFQTNLLALNAAVEAARAGSAGKGFAVVADEVRRLAERCKDAAHETQELIERTVLAVASGTRLAGTTADVLQRVAHQTETVQSSVLLIDRASQEQSAALHQLTSGIEQISGVVQTNSATAEQSAAASEELSSQANVLKEYISTLQLRGMDEKDAT